MIELINLIIHHPSPFNGLSYHYYIWIPALSFVFNEGTMFKNTVSLEMANIWMCGNREYEMHDNNAGEFAKNYTRKMNLKSILD